MLWPSVDRVIQAVANAFTSVDSRMPADQSGLVGYFGYGSLANPATLRTDVAASVPARLAGWRRVFRDRPARAPKFGGIGPAVLTAEADCNAAIDGMLVIDRLENLPAVDQRENLYRRVTVAADALAFAGERPPLALPLYVYERDYEPEATGNPSPILRSYLDAVMQGFLHGFGEEGLCRFVAETAGLGRPIVEDRDEPVYPRAVWLTGDEAALFSRVLNEASGERP